MTSIVNEIRSNAAMSATAPAVLDYRALIDTPVTIDPFAHVVVPDFVPPHLLSRIHAELPDTGRGGSFPPEALKLGALCRQMVQELESPRLKQIIAEKFGLDLADAPSMLTVRLATRATDGQIPPDPVAKRVTVLLYLNPPGPGFEGQEGCLRLLRSPDDLEDYAVEIPPVRGTLLVFPNSPTAWHGHKPHVGSRHSIQLNYMTNDGRAGASFGAIG